MSATTMANRLTGIFAKAGLDLELFYVPVPRAKGDLIGVPAHLAAAIFAMVCEAISTATASVGMIVLLIATALRAPVLIASWKQLLGELWVRLFLLWVLWMALSISWSPDPWRGVERLATMKFFLWTPLLWPLHRQWRWLLAGLLLAATVLQGLQLAGVAFGATHHGESIQAGMRHPTMTGLWDAIALSCWLFMSVAAGWGAALLCIPMAVFSAIGFVWAGQRAALVAILVEVLIANIVLVFAVRSWMRRAISRFFLGLAVVGMVYFLIGDTLSTKLKQTLVETEQSIQSNTPQVMEDRLAMWKMSLIAWRGHPIIGVGLGGYKKATANITEVVCPGVDIHQYDSPHSTYVMILTENGAVGLSLFAVWVGAFFVRAFQCVRLDPTRIGVFGGAVIWFSAAAVDTFHMRGVFLTVGVILIALATMPLPARRGAGGRGPASPGCAAAS